MSKQLFDFDDILIQPADITHIESRSEINTRYRDYLPLMTAPMDTVVSQVNKQLFDDLGIRVALPRISNPDNNYVSSSEFLSYSLTDFEKIFLDRTPERKYKKMFALIDVANGHMENVYEFAKSAKIKYEDDLVLMVGNVANPDTYHKFTWINVDYVRIGIGNGAGCLTTQQTGIGYPMASLIEECGDIKTKKHYMGNCKPYETKIVADGGFQKYSDIIKALALGADYVMLGSIFNKALESAGETNKRKDSTLGGYELISQYSLDALKMFNADMELTKVFRGMSTKEVQRDWGKEKLTTSEGVVRRHKVEYTLAQWVENFEDYLKSAMSYTDKKTLPEFIGKVQYNFISGNSLKRFSK
jgi:IMP dehydrogenase/GMP reductase